MVTRRCIAVLLLVGTVSTTHRDYVGELLDVRTLPRNGSAATLPRCPVPGVDVKKGQGQASADALMRAGVRAMRVRGLFNTGTNYMSSILLRLGFPEATVDSAGFVDGSGKKRWKHAPLFSERTDAFVAANWNEANLVVVRHPVAWALSTMTRSYDLRCACPAASNGTRRRPLCADPRRPQKGCCAEVGVKDNEGRVVKAMAWRSVLEGPCAWPVKQKPNARPKIVHDPEPAVAGGLGDVWSAYYGSYLDAPNSMFVRYEDVLRDPVAVVLRVAEAARCDVPPVTEGVRGNLEAVLHHRTGYFFAKDAASVAEKEHEAVLDEDWRRQIPRDRLASFCATLNGTLLALFRYTCVDDAWAPPSEGMPTATLEARVAALEAANGELRGRVAALESGS